MTTVYHPTLCGQICAVTEGQSYALMYSLADAADALVRLSIDIEEATGEAALASSNGREAAPFLDLALRLTAQAQRLLAVIYLLAPSDVQRA